MSAYYDISTMTSPEFAAALETASLALLPVGATEQHGPNLGLGVDYRIAEAIAERVAERLHPKAVVAPPLPFGVSDQHLGFSGTISISSQTFQQVCLEVVRSLAHHGLRRFIFVNGHQGNMATLNILTSRILNELGLRAATVFWMAQAKDAVERHRKTERWGHACEIETSIAMALCPDLVNEVLEPGDLIEDYGAYEDNYGAFAVQTPKPFHERTRNGAFGDATQATQEAGEEIVEATVERAVAFAEDFILLRQRHEEVVDAPRND